MDNKRIRMVIELVVNEETLKEKDLTVKDVIEGVRFNEHDAIDGFEITTDIPGCDCCSDYFLFAGSVVSVEEIEAPKVNRLDRINAYKSNEAFLKATAEQKLQFETQDLIEQIQALKPRIDELIVTGNACKENGIEMTGQAFGGHEGYDTHQFYTNCWSHLVGFVGTRDSKITLLGIDAGGACGNWNFRTDGDKVYSVYGKETQGPSVDDMKKFLKKFDEFESSFYAYVDKVIEKQQKSVESVIAEATGRVKSNPSGVDEKELDL